MKKNLILMLWLASIIVIAWCWWQKSENSDTENKWNNIIANDENPWVDSEDIAKDHPEWVAVALTAEDLNRIEETLPFLSYSYQVFDTASQSVVKDEIYEVPEGENPVFIIPDYATMATREVISSKIVENTIYTNTKITLQDGTELEVSYMNEPDTLLCRSILVKSETQTTLYTNFIYPSDLK